MKPLTWAWSALTLVFLCAECAPGVPAEPPRLRINQAGLEARLRALGAPPDDGPEASESAPTNAQGAKKDAASAKSASPTSTGQLFRVQYGNVILRRTTIAAKLGEPRLVYARDDHDESFLAAAELDPHAIDRELEALRGTRLTFHGAEESPCDAELTDFKLIAWAMPKDVTLAMSWDDMAEAALASSIFEHGNIYIVGTTTPDKPSCTNASWAISSGHELRLEEAVQLDPQAQPESIQTEPPVAYLAQWDPLYARLNQDGKAVALPARWQDLPGTFRIWGFADRWGSIKIVNFERRVTPELLGRANEPGLPWFFQGGVAVWQTAESAPTFVGPTLSVLLETEELRHVTAIHLGHRTPLLSLVSTRQLITLSETSGQFELVDELSIAPAP